MKASLGWAVQDDNGSESLVAGLCVAIEVNGKHNILNRNVQFTKMLKNNNCPAQNSQAKPPLITFYGCGLRNLAGKMTWKSDYGNLFMKIQLSIAISQCSGAARYICKIKQQIYDAVHTKDDSVIHEVLISNCSVLGNLLISSLLKVKLAQCVVCNE